MRDPVLHIFDPDYRLDRFTLLNQIHLSRGVGGVTLHVDREGGAVEIITVDRDGARGDWVAERGQCGCP